MRFNQTIEYHATRQDVSRMLKDPQYYRRRYEAFDTKAKVDVNQLPGTLNISTTLNVSYSEAEPLTSLVKSGLEIRMMEVWNLDEDGEVQKGTVSLVVTGAPAKASLIVTLHEPQAGQTQATICGDITCTMPIVGSAVEKSIAKIFLRALVAQPPSFQDYSLPDPNTAQPQSPKTEKTEP